MTIDEAADALGIELLPWQRDVGQRILDGERVVMVGGLRAEQGETEWEAQL